MSDKIKDVCLLNLFILYSIFFFKFFIFLCTVTLLKMTISYPKIKLSWNLVCLDELILVYLFKIYIITKKTKKIRL